MSKLYSPITSKLYTEWAGEEIQELEHMLYMKEHHAEDGHGIFSLSAARYCPMSHASPQK